MDRSMAGISKQRWQLSTKKLMLNKVTHSFYCRVKGLSSLAQHWLNLPSQSDVQDRIWNLRVCSTDSPMLARRQVMAWTSAPAYTSLSWLTTGRHRVWTLIRLFPTGTDGWFVLTCFEIWYKKRNTKDWKAKHMQLDKLRCNSVWVSEFVYLYWTCRGEQPESRQERSLPESRRLTSGQQRQSLGSHLPGTAGQWIVQRSSHGTYGWTNLRVHKRESRDKTDVWKRGVLTTKISNAKSRLWSYTSAQPG